MSSKEKDKKDFDKFSKFFVLKGIQIIVQSRLGEKIKNKSKPFSSGADWFNLAITDNNDVQSEAKKILASQNATLEKTVCIEISLRTSEGETMVLEIWYISIDPKRSDISAHITQVVYSRMSIALKSLITITRATPAYKLSRQQGGGDYVICYRIYLGEPPCYILGDGAQKAKVGSVPTPFGTIGIHLAYRTKLLMSPHNTSKEIEVKDDHFKQDNSPVRTTTPKPCIQGYRRASLSGDSDSNPCDESCTTTFSTSPADYYRMGTNQAPHHHQSQPIKIIETQSPITESTNVDFRAQSAPDKSSGFLKDIHRVGAFAQHHASDKNIDTEEVPFFSLLQQVQNERKSKPATNLNVSKGTSSTKTDSSKAESSESGLSESKTSTSSQASAPEDFVMVDIKTPFAGADANSDLGKFYREFQSAPSLADEEIQTVPETYQKIQTQLDVFETKMKDFDDFVSALNIDSNEGDSTACD